VDALIIVVVTAQQTDAVLFGDQGAAATMTPGSIVIASATVSPEFAQQLGDRLEGMGLELIGYAGQVRHAHGPDDRRVRGTTPR
jgi:3-hydroxyisobutyrate dehydrogenase